MFLMSGATTQKRIEGPLGKTLSSACLIQVAVGGDRTDVATGDEKIGQHVHASETLQYG